MNAWEGERRPSWLVERLDATDTVIEKVEGVTGGKVEIVAQSRLGGSAGLDITAPAKTFNWMRDRLKITYDPGIQGAAPFPLGVFLPSSPRLTHSAPLVKCEVDLSPKTIVIDEDFVDGSYSLAAGTPIIPAVKTLIESTGERRIAITPSVKLLANNVSWDAGTSKLTIVNDLLAAAGYWSLWCDGSGQFRVEPYLLPKDRRVTWEFRSGDSSIHKPEWSEEQDLSSVPNKFIVVSEGTAGKAAIVGVATNENPKSPFSYQSRGRWVTRRDIISEVDSVAGAVALAQRRLLDAMGPVLRLEVTHAIVPLEPDQLVKFVTERGGTRLATVQRMTFPLSFDAHCRAEWREVQ